MMDRQTVDQGQLFYLFNLEERIPSNRAMWVKSSGTNGLVTDSERAHLLKATTPRPQIQEPSTAARIGVAQVIEMSVHETSDRLRRDIDCGRTADKVAGTDPASAPLGTDEEAAARPPSHVEVAIARNAELSHSAHLDDPHAHRHGLGSAWILIAFVVLFAAALIAWAAATKGFASAV